MIPFAIGLGMVLSFLASELVGISAGGLVVPGYLAFFIDQPRRLAATVLLAVIVVGLVRFLDRYLVLYGRRRFMVTVLLGFAAGALWRDTLMIMPGLVEFYAIGLIVPGLLAYEMDRQGIVPTAAMTLLLAGLVRACLWVIA